MKWLTVTILSKIVAHDSTVAPVRITKNELNRKQSTMIFRKVIGDELIKVSMWYDQFPICGATENY